MFTLQSSSLARIFSFQKRPYAFNYGVRDERSGADFEQNEERSGLGEASVTRGSYKVALPDGRVQIVTYVADDSGYKATVTYEGEASYPSPSEYAYDAKTHDRSQGVPVLSHPRPKHSHRPRPRLPPPVQQSIPPHEAYLPRINLNHFRQPAESVIDEVEVRSNAIPRYDVVASPKPPRLHHPHVATYSTPKPPVSRTTPYYTTIEPSYGRPERPRPTQRPYHPPSPPTYIPVRHKRKNSKYSSKLDRLREDIRKESKRVATADTEEEKPQKSNRNSKARGYLPKFANFEPSPDHSKPDGTHSLEAVTSQQSKRPRKVSPASIKSISPTPKPTPKKLFFGPYTRDVKTTTESPPLPPASLTGLYIGPYAGSAYVEPTTYRPSKEFLQKLKNKRELNLSRDDE
jgi:hypothetical protein